MLSKAFILAALSAPALAVQVCHDGYCCSGSISGGCSSDLSDFVCCVGDTNHGIQICVGNGKPTCSAGSATPLTAPGGSVQTATARSSSAVMSTSNAMSSSEAASSSVAASSSGTGFFVPGTIISSGTTYSTGTTVRSTESSAAAGGSNASPSASQSALPSASAVTSGNAAVGQCAAGDLALAAMPLAWLLGV
ncbi:hypothetical protein LTR09_004852 [Extremus antarcticus]|uniref:Uncharacterized protein n=1 Tax=Extremus antarcticus TaxID=702011 RepID=A0AAJ0DNZ6_9PEZI|nr:hypothetical protein LTR09_004852 [Extremus antarcticus]